MIKFVFLDCKMEKGLQEPKTRGWENTGKLLYKPDETWGNREMKGEVDQREMGCSDLYQIPW